MKLTKRDIRNGIDAVKKKAEKSYLSEAYTEALHYLNVCTSLSGQFNFQYADDAIEKLLKGIAEKTIKQVKLSKNSSLSM